MDVRLIKPNFSASIAGIAFGNITLADSTIKAGYYQTYNLRFSINESQSPYKFGSTEETIDVVMTSLVSAPIYEHQIHKLDGAQWNWTTVTKIMESVCC